jgi:hypothetical protein
MLVMHLIVDRMRDARRLTDWVLADESLGLGFSGHDSFWISSCRAEESCEERNDGRYVIARRW